MDVVLRFIGIILLVANPEKHPTSYDVYIQDARVAQNVCSGRRHPHYAAIRLRMPGVTSSGWKTKKCSDGKDCMLFELEHDRIEIDGITNGGTVTTGQLKYLPHLRYEMGVNALIPAADRERISAGLITLTNGTLTDDKFPNSKMPYAVLTAKHANAQVTITAGNKVIKIPKQANTMEIDFIDLPDALATGSFNGVPSNERGHFEWHYRYADANNQTCNTPFQNSTSIKTKKATGKVEQSTPMSKPNKTTVAGRSQKAMFSANADCSATTWP